MSIKNVYYSTKFKKHLKKLNPEEQKKVEKKLRAFLKNPFSSQLHTHKLSGKLENYWSFSITYSLRVLFEFIDQESVGLIDIGTHEIYR